MKQFLTAFLILAAPGLALAQAPGDAVTTTFSYYTGEAFLDLSKRNQQIYVSGLSDAYNEAFRHGYGEKPVVICTQGREDKDLADVFRIWLQGRPYRLKEPAPRLFADAMKDTCA